MTKSNKQYRVNLISDAPAEADSFGPHDRLASAVVDLINREEGGRTIALEGGWGSGKSTVINLVQNKMQSLNSKDEYTFILFDAWAHEGDPLRRTFLETLINHFLTLGWIEKYNDTRKIKDWERKLDELARRRKISRQRRLPDFGVTEYLLALTVLLVPIGFVTFNKWMDNPGIGSASQIFLLVTWIVLIGSPLWLFTIYFFLSWVKQGKDFSVRKFFREAGGLLTQNGEAPDTLTLTIEAPEPTSVEFEEIFSQLMIEALADNKARKAILALDNLDRIANKDALTILSALQTFLQYKEHHQPIWFKKLYILIPYDPNGLAKLWDDTDIHNGRKIATAFFDKSFQVRFEVPPLLISDQRTYLMSLLKLAFPDHDESEFHAVYRIYDTEREEEDEFRTPRDLKVYVNQIGSIVRQWTNTFPMSHVGYYVLLQRKGVSVQKELSKSDFPNVEMTSRLGTELKANLASIAYNEEREKALQIVMGNDLKRALASKQTDKLKEMQDKIGFWEVLEKIEFDDWVESESTKIATAALNLNQISGSNHIYTDLETTTVTNLVNAAVNVKTWTLFNTEIAEGLNSLVRMSRNQQEVAKQLLNSISAGELNNEQIPSWTKGALILTQNLADMDLVKHNELNIKVPATLEGYILMCSHLVSQDPEGVFWTIFKPKEDTEDVVNNLQDAIQSDNYSGAYIALIRVFVAQNVEVNWNTLLNTIVNKIQQQTPVASPMSGNLLETLWQLRDVTPEADKRIKELVSQGFIAHVFHHRKSDVRTAVWCIFLILNEDNTVSQPQQSHNALDGYNFIINQIFQKPENHTELTEAFLDLIYQTKHYELPLLVYEQQSKAHPLLDVVLQKALNDENEVVKFFPVNIILEKYTTLERALKTEGFKQLIHILVDTADFVQHVMQSEFSADYSIVYRSIFEASNFGNDDFFEWIHDGLKNISKDRWITELKSEDNAIKLLFYLLEDGKNIELGIAYQDAIEAHSELILNKTTNPDFLLKQSQHLLTPLTSSAKKTVLRRIYDNVKDKEGKIPSIFFDMYGRIISDTSIIREDQRIVARLFVPLLMQNNVRGLLWLSELLGENNDLLTNYEPDGEVDDFRLRISELLTNQEQDENTRPSVEKIADILGIERDSSSTKSSDESSE